MSGRVTQTVFVVLPLLATLSGCASTVEDAEPPVAPAGESTQAIHPLPGRSAAAYSEAVLVKVNNAANDFRSGVLVAPRVVLTAAHCVVYNVGGTWTIKAPFTATGVQTQTTAVNAAEPMDALFATLPASSYDSSNLYHDLGLIYLTTPFTGVNYPDLFNTAATIGASVSAIGRDAVNVNANLILSSVQTLAAPDAFYTFDYKTNRVTDGGDSGGPLFLEGTHTLVGTETRFSTSGANQKDWWLRLDGTPYVFIAGKVASHGGWAIDFFRNDVSSALCTRVAACCAVATPGYTVTQSRCAAVYDKLGFEATARDVDAANKDRVTVDAATKTACLNAIGTSTADCSLASAEIKAAITDCLGSITGRVALDGACGSSTECAGNAVCERNVAGVGTCKAVRPNVGDSCEIVYKTGTDIFKRDNLAQDLCSKRGDGQSSRFCEAYDFTAGIDAHRAENTWTCQPKRADGQKCNTNAYCTSSVCAPFGTANAFTCQAAATFAPPAVCTAFD